MNLNTIQLVGPTSSGASPFSVVPRRILRVALVYLAIAATGVVLAVSFSFLTLRAFAVVGGGLIAGLGVANSLFLFVVLCRHLLMGARHFEHDLRTVRRVCLRLFSVQIEIVRESKRVRFDPESTQRLDRDPEPAPSALSYVWLAFLPGLFLFDNASLLFRWSTMTGLIAGLTIFVVARLIFHLHLFINRRDQTTADPTIGVDRSHKP